jgi:hypothetical protein
MNRIVNELTRASLKKAHVENMFPSVPFHVINVYDDLVAHPEGATTAQIAKRLGVSGSEVRRGAETLAYALVTYAPDADDKLALVKTRVRGPRNGGMWTTHYKIKISESCMAALTS